MPRGRPRKDGSSGGGSSGSFKNGTVELRARVTHYFVCVKCEEETNVALGDEEVKCGDCGALYDVLGAGSPTDPSDFGSLLPEDSIESDEGAGMGSGYDD